MLYIIYVQLGTTSIKFMAKSQLDLQCLKAPISSPQYLRYNTISAVCRMILSSLQHVSNTCVEHLCLTQMSTKKNLSETCVRHICATHVTVKYFRRKHSCILQKHLRTHLSNICGDTDVSPNESWCLNGCFR